MIATDQIISTPTVELPASRAASLRRWNIGLGLVHAVQAVAVLALATAFALPVTATFMVGPPGTAAGAPTNLFDVSVAWGVALFLLLSAVFHWLVVLPGVFGRYTSGLVGEHNYFRWAEYSLSSSVMIVLIAMLTGISDVAALIGIFAANAAMICAPATAVTTSFGIALLMRAPSCNGCSRMTAARRTLFQSRRR